MNYFIIPGNPPARHFYESWKREILAENPGAAVHITTYCPIPGRIKSESYFERAVENQLRDLSHFRESRGKPVHIVGHSLGAWMACRLVERAREDVDRCFLLFPFLSRPAPRGLAVFALVRALRRVPFAVRSRRFFEVLAKDLRLVTDEEIGLGLELAFHEYQAIGKKRGLPLFSPELRAKFHAIYCDGDHWFPPSTVSHVTNLVSHEKVKAVHDFVVSRGGRERVFSAMQKELAANGPVGKPLVDNQA